MDPPKVHKTLGRIGYSGKASGASHTWNKDISFLLMASTSYLRLDGILACPFHVPMSSRMESLTLADLMKHSLYLHTLSGPEVWDLVAQEAAWPMVVPVPHAASWRELEAR